MYSIVFAVIRLAKEGRVARRMATSTKNRSYIFRFVQLARPEREETKDGKRIWKYF